MPLEGSEAAGFDILGGRGMRGAEFEPIHLSEVGGGQLGCQS